MKKKDPTSHRIIEKRRRDRMNNCLADLSKLIPSHYMRKGRGRVEKTEIIEMAIRHLKDLRESTASFLKSQGKLVVPMQGCVDLDGAQQQTSIATTVNGMELSAGNLRLLAAEPVSLDASSQAVQQRPNTISATNGRHMTENTAENMHGIDLYHQTPGHQKPPLANTNTSASLSMKAFRHQQFHNNEHQINSRANEQNKYRNECCVCRGRSISRTNDCSSGNGNGASNGASNNGNGNCNGSGNSNGGANNGVNNKNSASSSDQSDTGSTDYPSSSCGSSGSQKAETINKSTSESSCGEGSPTSSVSSSSSSLSSSSSSTNTASSNSSGWYKKAWLMRSVSRSSPKS
jgi:hypothetical protein